MNHKHYDQWAGKGTEETLVSFLKNFICNFLAILIFFYSFYSVVNIGKNAITAIFCDIEAGDEAGLNDPFSPGTPFWNNTKKSILLG